MFSLVIYDIGSDKAQKNVAFQQLDLGLIQAYGLNPTDAIVPFSQPGIVTIPLAFLISRGGRCL